MSADKISETLLTALKQAATEQGEQRLFRSGKLPGLFSSPTGVGAEAAALALREGLLEVVRTETKGKSAVEWVRLTPKGVEHLHDGESPTRALEELRAALRTLRERVPSWQSEMRGVIEEMANRLAEDSRRLVQTVEALTRRVEETLKRVEELRPTVPETLTATTPWANEALAYLDRRRSANSGPCPLPELFESLAELREDLTVSVFHEGLRRLHDEKLLQLLPLTSPGQELAQPEFALLHRATLYYCVTR
jgi:AcrR family transcriptional regulator